MLDAESFHKLVSGKARGIRAAIIRATLTGVSIPYGWVVHRRNHGFNTGRSKITQVSCPVVCVGNLTLGGTGKTPMVRYVARYLEQEGIRVVLVSRGYGSQNGKPNDEALELAQLLPHVPHIQNRDRVAASYEAIEKHSAETILLDDGFQHRRLARDLDIVLLDALEPFGFNRLFPRGLLREPVAGIARADIVVLNRADLIPKEAREEIRQRVNELAPNTLWCETAIQPTALIGKQISEAGENQSKTISIESLQGKRIAAFCGLGNPEGFWHTLTHCGLHLIAKRAFPDHYAYRKQDLHNIADWAKEQRAEAILCTLKDYVKIPKDIKKEIPLWAIGIEIEFLHGKKSFEDALSRRLKK